MRGTEADDNLKSTDPCHGFIDVFAAVEGRQPEVPLTGGPEAAAWGAHHVGFVEQVIKEASGVHAIWGLDPDVGGVFTAVGRQTGGGEFPANDRRIFHVKADQGLDLSLAGF